MSCVLFISSLLPYKSHVAEVFFYSLLLIVRLQEVCLSPINQKIEAAYSYSETTALKKVYCFKQATNIRSRVFLLIII